MFACLTFSTKLVNMKHFVRAAWRKMQTFCACHGECFYLRMGIYTVYAYATENKFLLIWVLWKLTNWQHLLAVKCGKMEENICCCHFLHFLLEKLYYIGTLNSQCNVSFYLPKITFSACLPIYWLTQTCLLPICIGNFWNLQTTHGSSLFARRFEMLVATSRICCYWN